MVPYLRLMRLHQPTGIWLLLWPCWWSIALAADFVHQQIVHLAIFAMGAVVMRSAGCIINDIIDRDIDKKVARTMDRPLASGAVSLANAVWLLITLLAFGLALLVQLNMNTILMGVGFMCLVVLYPFAKRVTGWPQLVLALTFNAGALMGWVAVQGTLEAPALWLYAACMFWTLGYDTIYAHQDKRDDAVIGVKSSALSLGAYTRPVVRLFYLAMVVCLVFAGGAISEHNLYYYGILVIALGLLMWQVQQVDLDAPQQCMRAFKDNTLLGWIVFLAIVAEQYI